MTARGAGRAFPWLVAAAAVAVLYFFRGLLVPLFLAGGLAYLLNPAIAWAQARAIRRDVSVLALFLLLALALVAAQRLLGPVLQREAAAVASGLPRTLAQVETVLAEVRTEAARALPVLGRLIPPPPAEPGWMAGLVAGEAGGTGALVQAVGTVLTMVVLVPFFAFFFLRDSKRSVAFLMDRIPPRHVETSVALWCEIDQIIGRYLRGVALDGLAVGALTTAGMWLAGIPYPLLLGVVTGCASVVPMLGVVLGAGAAVVVALTQGLGLKGVGLALLVFAIVKLVDDVVLQPLTIGRSVHQHPLLVVASIIAGGEAFGLVGMFLAVPAITVVQETVRLLLERRGGLRGLSARAAPVFIC